MKQILILTFLLISLINSSCSKKEEPVVPGQLPSWVKQKVDDLTADGEPCNIVFILYFEVGGEKYYNIDFGYSDCAFCNIFDEKGRKVSQQNLPTGEKKVLEWYPGCE